MGSSVSEVDTGNINEEPPVALSGIHLKSDKKVFSFVCNFTCAH